MLLMLAACGQQATPSVPADSASTSAQDTANNGNGEVSNGEVSSDAPIIISSKDFNEQFIISEMYALLLEDAGFTIERKFNLGNTPLVHAALQNGEVDLYPEYTGTGLLTVLKEPSISDPQQVYDTVSTKYREQFGIVWLDPAPMNNTQALAMTRETAEQYGITTISDMVPHASELVMIGPPEFQEREDGLPGLKKVYGNFTLKEYKGFETGLRYPTLISGEADVVVAFSTDGEISEFDLLVLEDDKAIYPPYQVAPLVRQDTLDAPPGIAEVLNTLAPYLTNKTMQRLNYEVSGNKKEPAEVAKTFLVAEGLLEE
jgi:osmoprotectant transport system substrate-binding protein